MKQAGLRPKGVEEAGWRGRAPNLAVLLSGVLLWISVALFGSRVAVFSEGVAQTSPPPTAELQIGTDLIPSIELGFKGGTNEYGKITVITPSGVDFGSVTFTRPELISNGDAYWVDPVLRLEAVLEVKVNFNSISQVALTLTQQPKSSNPFYASYYSVSLRRSEILNPIQGFPRENQVKVLTQPEEVPLRLAFDIQPRQQGRLVDYFRITARVFP
jgi:hypothetical protein